MNYIPKIRFEPDKNLLYMDDIPISLHCHHFNCGLINAIERIDYFDAIDIYINEAAKCFYNYLKKILLIDDTASSIKKALIIAEDIYRFMGYGRIDLSKLVDGYGSATSDSSYFVVGWFAIYGRRNKPICYLTRGFLKAVIAVIFKKDITRVNVLETQCMICGDDSCKFEIYITEDITEDKNGS